MISSETIQINLRLPLGMAREIEKEAKKGNYRSRQEYIMEALREGINRKREASQ